MKVIKEKIFTLKYVVPENKAEELEIKQIIKNAENEKLDTNISHWKITDNRKKIQHKV